MAISFDLWFGTIKVEVINRELHIRSGHLGITRSRVIAASAIQDFVLKSNLQQGDHIWYDLQLKLISGRPVTVGSGLDKQEAEWFRAELKKDLGWRA
ncbi:MAG: hypothetical protein EXQ47_11355 [Bryobacterales bacterium]|nr:hypothetical protein [Bryobacterales bacterium]